MRRTWIKLYIEQCLRGSMIAELTPEQRWIFIGLLLLAGDSEVPGLVYRRKDEFGNMIGYSDVVLADTLGVDDDEIKVALVKMVQRGKITIDPYCVISICNWTKYQSEYLRQKPGRTKVRRLAALKCRLDVDVDRDVDVDVKKNNGRKSGPLSKSDIDKKFSEFWTAYPREGRLAKKESRRKFGALVKRGELEEFIKAFHSYLDYLKDQKVNENFDQRPMYAKTLLNDRWREYIGFEFKPRP